MTQFKQVGLIGRLHSPAVIETLHRVIKCLNRCQCDVWVDERIVGSLNKEQLASATYGTGDRHFLGQQCIWSLLLAVTEVCCLQRVLWPPMA